MNFLLLNQTFHPDVMATGQYLAELAVALTERGHQVTVVTSQRAYDDPATCFAKHEVWRGITIHRVGSTRFGKGAKWKRAADFGSFMLACCFRLLTLPRHDVVLALTSPPLISFIGAWLAKLRRSRFVYWVMDFNPDEAIAAGWLRADSLAGRVLDKMSRFSLRRADKLIALDHFMRDRIVAKGITADKIVVLPPWSYDDQVRFDPAGREEFRRRHGLADKFVVMYSGNHSPVHPLDTLLDAARRLAGQRDIVFAFIGGGSEFKRIQSEMLNSRERQLLAGGSPETPGARERAGATPSAGHQTINPQPSTPNNLSAFQHVSVSECPPSALRHPSSTQPSTHNLQPCNADPLAPPAATAREQGGSDGERVGVRGSQPFGVSAFPNLFCLPYQPLSELAASLSAADLHVVVMGNAFVGLVHPCKIYNILAVGAPMLYIGPEPSHVTEILAGVAAYPHLSVRHGDGESLAQQILARRNEPSNVRLQTSASRLEQFSKQALLPKFLAVLETG